MSRGREQWNQNMYKIQIEVFNNIDIIGKESRKDNSFKYFHV